MPPPAKNFLTTEQITQLHLALKENELAHVRERILIILLQNDGKTHQEISKFLGCSPRTVAYWCTHGDPDKFINSKLQGYRLAQTNSNFGGTEQRWVIVESVARQQSDIKQLYTQLDKLESVLEKQLVQLRRQDFQCESDAMQAAQRFSKKLKYHCLEAAEVVQQTHHPKPGRPRKDTTPCVNYQIRANERA